MTELWSDMSWNYIAESPSAVCESKSQVNYENKMPLSKNIEDASAISANLPVHATMMLYAPRIW